MLYDPLHKPLKSLDVVCKPETTCAAIVQVRHLQLEHHHNNVTSTDLGQSQGSSGSGHGAPLRHRSSGPHSRGAELC